VNCWVIWHIVILDMLTELLENLNGNEQSTVFLAAYMVYIKLKM